MQDSTGQGALDRLCPAGVQNLLDIFTEAGVGAYPVGGCVRDALMGRTPHDWDIAVTCPPDRTVALCAAAGLRTVPTGIAHGTVTVLVPAPAGGRMPVECTTCRTETGYSDGRHPDSVAFSDRIQDDLSRRDFTVNAMAAERDAAGHFRVLDLFGGLDDLAGRVIRCVGDPERRLREDALRVLRGVRFSVRLGFEPEPDTRAALIRCAPELAHISGERVREELRGILTSPDPDRGVAMLYRLGLAPYVLPRPSGAAESLAQRGGFARLDGFPSRLAALLWGLSAPDLEADLRRLRLSGEETQRVRARLALAGELPGAALPLPEAARRLRARLGRMPCRRWLSGRGMPPFRQGLPMRCVARLTRTIRSR
ncbi:MAG: tRNA nucleotidyltransferase [Oscillospiraceae bacterium]|nr:MAG: tRNA nucleotidyltransferase [Oscillospiraceae bacterium]